MFAFVASPTIDVSVGTWITIAFAAFGGFIAWGKITARLEAISANQDKLVSTDGLRAAMAEMKNDLLERIEKKIEKELGKAGLGQAPPP